MSQRCFQNFAGLLFVCNTFFKLNSRTVPHSKSSFNAYNSSVGWRHEKFRIQQRMKFTGHLTPSSSFNGLKSTSKFCGSRGAFPLFLYAIPFECKFIFKVGEERDRTRADITRIIRVHTPRRNKSSSVEQIGQSACCECCWGWVSVAYLGWQVSGRQKTSAVEFQ